MPGLPFRAGGLNRLWVCFTQKRWIFKPFVTLVQVFTAYAAIKTIALLDHAHEKTR